MARAATDAARCPVGQQSAFAQCNGGTATAVNRILEGRPVAGKTGSSEQAATETFVGFTPQVAVAGIAANPDDPTDLVGSAVQARVIEAVARIIRTAVDGQPQESFTAPSRDLVGTPAARSNATRWCPTAARPTTTTYAAGSKTEADPPTRTTPPAPPAPPRVPRSCTLCRRMQVITP